MPNTPFDTGADSQRPDAVPLDPETGKKLPLFAFHLLRGGDAFEVTAGKPPADGRARAQAYLATRVKVRRHGADRALVNAVEEEMVWQLEGNPQLVARLTAARPIEVDLVPRGRPLVSLGYPAQASAGVSGLFWDHPSWPHARMALRQDALEKERALVIHEMAHAIQRLAFTQREQDTIYRLMLPVYRSRTWVDEVFAIYSEREFLPHFTEREGHAPGVYGLARRRWDERHVFTRFVRNLYFPFKPLAGSAPL
jgi:hypothetical protein